MLNFKSYFDLSRDIAAGIQKIPQVDLVVGVPKSGLIPATIIASFLNVQVMDLDSFLFSFSRRSGVRRHKSRIEQSLHVLIVDDSVNTGTETYRTKQRLTELEGAFRFTYCAVYGLEAGAHEDVVDVVLAHVPHPRFFQWNYRNHIVAEHALFDMDGVLCVDPPEDKNDDGELYRDYILNAPPLFIPRKKISGIVTSRLERYRAETETWLERNGVVYGDLIMLDLPTAEERRRLRIHAPFKAETYAARDELLFVESNWKQAQSIALAADKPVICTENDAFLMSAEHVRGLKKTNQLFSFDQLNLEEELRRQIAELTERLSFVDPHVGDHSSNAKKKTLHEVSPLNKERNVQRFLKDTHARFPEIPPKTTQRRILMLSRSFDPLVGAGAAMSSLRLRDALVAEGGEVFSLTADDFSIGSEKRINQPIYGQNIGFWNHYCDPDHLEVLQTHIERIDPDVIVMGAVDNGIVSLVDLAMIERPIVWCARDNWSHTGGCLFKLEPDAVVKADPSIPSEFMTALTCTGYFDGCGDCPALSRVEERYKAKAQYKLKEQILRYRKDIVFAPISTWMQNTLLAAPLTKNHTIFTIHNPVDLTFVKPLGTDVRELRSKYDLPPDKKLVLIAAQSSKNVRKGVQLVIDQLPFMPSLNDVQLVIIGRSDLDPVLASQGDRIHALGFVSDEQEKLEIYNAVDAVLVPALQESLSVVASDAIAVGKPVIAFETSGLKDLIDHRQNGWLAPPYDSHNLLEGLRWVLFDADSTALKSAARRKAKEVLDQKQNTQRMLAAIDTAIAQHAELGTLPDGLKQTINLLSDLQRDQSFERAYMRHLQKQRFSSNKDVHESLRDDQKPVCTFVIKGQLSKRHLTQAHRLVVGSYKEGLEPAVYFEDIDWAKDTWVGQHFEKLDYVTLLKSLASAPEGGQLEISSGDTLILSPAKWQDSDIRELRDQHRLNIFARLFRFQTPSPPVDPGVFLVSQNWSSELSRLKNVGADSMIVLSKVATSWSVSADKSRFYKATLPSPTGFEKRLILLGKKMSPEDLYEGAMISRYLDRTPMRVTEVESEEFSSKEALAKKLQEAAHPVKITTDVRPMTPEEGVPLILEKLKEVYARGKKLSFAIPSDKF